MLGVCKTPTAFQARSEQYNPCCKQSELNTHLNCRSLLGHKGLNKPLPSSLKSPASEVGIQQYPTSQINKEMAEDSAGDSAWQMGRAVPS